eukprot:scaffold309021_cov19-Prasinocladus_malaysianus.AAC.1
MYDMVSGLSADIPAGDRKAAIDIMSRDGGAVMICTDSAARGLDIPNVTHVIQAEFALSAVDFIHRAGRTARAGAAGKLISLYTDDDAPLALAIRSAIESGVPVVRHQLCSPITPQLFYSICCRIGTMQNCAAYFTG